jgi:Protein of unknown function (DUF4236)/Bacterial SH3 domain
MPFYIRKSVSAGPFRFNLSNSGLGVSVGVKGLRVGTGPRGHYVHAGRGGLYYRASLGSARHASSLRHPPSSPGATTYAEQGRVTMIEIQSGDVAAMRDATVADFVGDLNKKQAQIPLGLAAVCVPALVGILALLQFSSSGQSVWVTVGSVALLAALPAWAIGGWFDSYKRTSVLLYNLEEASAAAYRIVTEAFDALAACRGKWHIASGGAVRDLTTWKRNAGAAHLVNRKNASLAYSLPKVLRSNITPPTITLGGRAFFFLPDVVLVKQGGRFGAVGYDDLQIRIETSSFIEDGTPVADAQIVGRTWKHPNKGGGPDRRFRDNRQLPVCLYDVMQLSSSSGVNELMEFSRTGVVQLFSAALHDLPHRAAPADSAGASALLGDSATPEQNNPTFTAPSTRQSPHWMFLAGLAALSAAAAAVVVAYTLPGAVRTSTGIHEGTTNPSSVPTTVVTQLSPTEAPNIIAQKLMNPPVQPGLPRLPIVTVRTPANIRTAPNSSARIIRVAGAGEKFGVFSRASGWVQVGLDKPLGWIAASLLAE